MMFATVFEFADLKTFPFIYAHVIKDNEHIKYVRFLKIVN